MAVTGYKELAPIERACAKIHEFNAMNHEPMSQEAMVAIFRAEFEQRTDDWESGPSANPFMMPGSSVSSLLAALKFSTNDVRSNEDRLYTKMKEKFGDEAGNLMFGPLHDAARGLNGIDLWVDRLTKALLGKK